VRTLVRSGALCDVSVALSDALCLSMIATKDAVRPAWQTKRTKQKLALGSACCLMLKCMGGCRNAVTWTVRSTFPSHM
jgi:hypothetical protein